jgi:hypothetical protein
LSNYEVYAHLSAQKKLLDPLIAAQQSQHKRRRFKADSTLYEEQTDKEKAKRMPTFMPPRDLDPDLGELSPEQEKQERLDEVRGTTVTGGVVMVQDAVGCLMNELTLGSQVSFPARASNSSTDPSRHRERLGRIGSRATGTHQGRDVHDLQSVPYHPGRALLRKFLAE